MDEIIIPIEYRQDNDGRGGPGRLTGILMPYGRRAGDRAEQFERGALRWPDAGILVRAMHERARPVLRAIPFLDGDNLRIDAAFPDTVEGRDAATNLREGIYTGLSVEFRTFKEVRRAGVRTILDAALTGAGLVDYPSYVEAVAEVRQQEHRRRRLWL